MNALTKKAGPLPRWAWLGLAGAVGLGLYLRHRANASNASSGAQTVDPILTATDPTSSIPFDGLGSGGVATGADPSLGTTQSYPSLAQEIGDVTDIITALGSLQGALGPQTPAPAAITDPGVSPTGQPASTADQPAAGTQAAAPNHVPAGAHVNQSGNANEGLVFRTVVENGHIIHVYSDRPNHRVDMGPDPSAPRVKAKTPQPQSGKTVKR